MKPLLYVAVVLGMSVSCKKEDPCGNTFCCGSPDEKLRFLRTVENARADTWSGGLVIVDSVRTVASYCFSQKDLYPGNLRVTYVEPQPQPYKYRVWGTVYRCLNCPTFIRGYVDYIKIDKIEFQN